MKICSSCRFPVVTTKKIITEVWGWILNQDYSDEVKITKKPRVIIFTQKECRFMLSVTLEPILKAIEEWNTPFGSHTKEAANNRGVLDYLNRWYGTLNHDVRLNVIEVMAQKGLIKLEIVNSVCSTCEQKLRIPRKKTKRKTKEKKEVTWKNLIQLYLEKNIHNTKERHPDTIAESLELSIAQVHENLEELEKEGVVRKEFKFFDYYILTKDYNSETARKHLEILDYLKQHLDCPSTKCTQFSISLSFDLPFAIVGFILNTMRNNRLIKKDTIEVSSDGNTRKIACYVPSSY